MADSTEVQWIACIGDLTGSRRLSASERRSAQERLLALMPRLDTIAGTTVAARFVVTAGDEFQGLLTDPSRLPELLWAITVEYARPWIRLGIGHGPLTTPLRPEQAIGMDGPTFHRARAAIESSAAVGADAPMFRGFGADFDRILDGLARGLAAHRRSWTERQRQVASELRSGVGQQDVANHLAISQQAVSKHAQTADLATDRSLEDALSAALALATSAGARP